MHPVPPGQSVLAVIQIARRDGNRYMCRLQAPIDVAQGKRDGEWHQCAFVVAGGRRAFNTNCLFAFALYLKPGSAPDKKRGPSLRQNVRVAALTVLA